MENNFKMIATTFYGMEEILAKEKNVFTISKKNNLGFSPRLHVMKWGSQRGK